MSTDAVKIIRTRAWRFLWFEPDMTPGSLMDALSFAQYSIFQEERYEDGTRVFHGYIYFKNPQICPKALMSNSCFWTRASASPFYVLYVTRHAQRTNGPWEQGRYPKTGKEDRVTSLVYPERPIV